MTSEILEPRRRPSQERSHVKFDHLLQVSRDLLTEVGFEKFTCEEVAHRAGLPIGTLYQFFANKYVIVCEIDRVHAVAVREEVASLAAQIPSLDWLDLLDRLLEHLVTLWRTDPSRRAVWHAVQSTPATRATAAVTERELAAEVLVHVTYSMLNFSIRDGQEHEEAVIELKRLLASYLLAAESTT
ncbi:TetR family transcriptional regulator [Nocardioides sp.]|uniref:TetR family transcriptional regulator n=1 Tax=Nocardioides sp. TaxID=35761 RepID=UPI002B9A0BEF|nr:TetR family transcriptional regulator [Nocardioides sp.]HSX67396.1 TetR family transcriptional regulator [Nocardioides sp.]